MAIIDHNSSILHGIPISIADGKLETFFFDLSPIYRYNYPVQNKVPSLHRLLRYNTEYNTQNTEYRRTVWGKFYW